MELALTAGHSADGSYRNSLVATPEGARVETVRTGGARRGEPALRVAAIAAGGALGTLARYGVNRAIVPAALGFPWATFVVNVTGSLLLGLAVTMMVERWSPTRFVRPFVAVGFCGGFTTFSTMVVSAAQLGQHGRSGLAAVYLVASLVAGLVAVVVGTALARGRLGPAAGRQGPIPDPDAMDGFVTGGRPGPEEEDR
jgi:fluoride exporter